MSVRVDATRWPLADSHACSFLDSCRIHRLEDVVRVERPPAKLGDERLLNEGAIEAAARKISPPRYVASTLTDRTPAVDQQVVPKPIEKWLQNSPTKPAGLSIISFPSLSSDLKGTSFEVQAWWGTIHPAYGGVVPQAGSWILHPEMARPSDRPTPLALKNGSAVTNGMDL
jgi:hypothetical protein